ncbi:hypothetical protein JX265_007472 [Neoarthrinium moseri]|uniref:Uncharacterized protein n=1 Tax=Neoarthrinium moseri TaxID=1658444 RepID=A0A9P9WKH6_9PEZI|nr:uncharacterized protein JN550_009828 [Neoarthrinium moseri]KAI1863092.1 hypothetical protein JN550_009828 [Neoarthrinium moseri]KAI1867670.1 hypothetical protein JX265_007472 [Neoarthrinium moseri]
MLRERSIISNLPAREHGPEITTFRDATLLPVAPHFLFNSDAENVFPPMSQRCRIIPSSVGPRWTPAAENCTDSPSSTTPFAPLRPWSDLSACALNDSIVPGTFWPKPTVQAPHPPATPAFPSEDSDWDSNFIGHAQYLKRFNVERRHSGWEAVERRWAQNHPAPTAQPQQIRALSAQTMEALSKLHPGLSLPPPVLEIDFRMRVVLNTNVATMAVGDGFKQWTTSTEGSWSGTIGHGTVIGGGQDSTNAELSGTYIESAYKLKTNDDPPAIIECKTRGFRTGPPDVMKALEDPDKAQTVDPRQYRHRTVITMRTSDSRYAGKVNFEMWVGTGLWRGSEVIYEYVH